jgi:hypothetical protein
MQNMPGPSNIVAAGHQSGDTTRTIHHILQQHSLQLRQIGAQLTCVSTINCKLRELDPLTRALSMAEGILHAMLLCRAEHQQHKGEAEGGGQGDKR